MKKLLSILSCLLLVSNTAFAEIATIDKFKGLHRNPKADRIDDGAHDQFQNVYLEDGNIQTVKGRVRLNATANSDKVINGLWYYEKQDNSTKKLLAAETDEIVSYDLDGTNKTSLISGLANTMWDATQIGDVMYFISSNGLYKWGGSGSVTQVTGATTTTSISGVTANYSPQGGLTPGGDAVVFPKFIVSSSYWQGKDGVGSCISGYTRARVGAFSTPESGEDWCASLNTSNFAFTCATSTTYCYKATQFNSITGAESEPSASSCSTSFKGNDYVSYAASDPFPLWTASGCTTGLNTGYQDVTFGYTRAYTSASISVSSVASPFDKVRLYRTVAGGGDYFLVGQFDPSTSVSDGKPDAVLGTPLDTTIDMIAPPAYRYIEEYKGTIFVAQGDVIKFSRLPTSIVTDADKYWLDSDELQISGQITGIKKVADSLVVFTKTSVYQITGFGVTSFRIIPLIQGTGSINDETIETDANGDLIFFAGSEGVYRIAVGQQPTDNLTGNIIDRGNALLTKLSAPMLNDVFKGIDKDIILNSSDYLTSHAYYDKDNDLYFLYIGSTCLLFDVQAGSWSVLPATKMIASTYTRTASGKGQGVIIDNAGFLYNNWSSYANGVTTGTVTGYPTASANNTLSCSTCSFNTTGSGLAGNWIFIKNENNEYHQILSNTATEITITDTWTTNPIPTDKFYVGYLHAKWRTKQYNISIPNEVYVTKLYLNHNKSDSEQILVIRSFEKKSNVAINEFQIDLSQKYIDVVNTRMRSPWLQWEFTTNVYNTSTTIDNPVDIISYSMNVESRERIE